MHTYKTVEEFINSQDDEKCVQIELLREIIFSAKPSLIEHIKWNSPSYIHDGEDRITFSLMNKEGLVKLVLHMGAVRKENKKAAPVLTDDTGLIVWSSDIRGIITFRDIEDIKLQKIEIAQLLVRWLSIAH